MSWIEEQIKTRSLSDDEMMTMSCYDLASVVMGEKITRALVSNAVKTENAIDEVLKYYAIKKPEIPSNIKDLNDKIDYLIHPSGMMRRTVILKEQWYKKSIGPLLCTFKENNEIVCVLPDENGNYYYKDFINGKKVKINKKNTNLFDTEAICFYRPFPNKKLNIKDLVTFMLSSLKLYDIVLFFIATFIASMLGLITPILTKYAYSVLIESGEYVMLGTFAIFYVSVFISVIIINTYKNLMSIRFTNSIAVEVEAAAMMRILNLPTSFFKKYSSGELATRMQYISEVCKGIMNTIFLTIITSIFSLAYVSEMFIYGGNLAIYSLVIIFLTIIVDIVATYKGMHHKKLIMHNSAKEDGIMYDLINGVQKIKLCGAEKRSFAKWSNSFKEVAIHEYNPPFIEKYSSVINLALSLIGTGIIYFYAVYNNMDTGSYFAFIAAYGAVLAAVSSITSMIEILSTIKPTIEMAMPILEEIPEISEKKAGISKLNGNIQIENLYFKYKEDMPYILEDFSLKIKAGQYVAIVGETGCGKSTLIRLLLGFEKAKRGAIFYDSKNINNIDLQSLRKNIGVVMQDGKIFEGDIYSNIVVAAPWLTLEDAWKAAKIAGIDEDIRQMPMQMNTYIGGGQGGISGGQKQRILIASAVAALPKILILDEATSALDNVTQKNISDALKTLKCTRIVVAHRLSTIKQCDRIIMIEDGKIVEDGTYDALIAKNGKFAKLVANQRLDIN